MNYTLQFFRTVPCIQNALNTFRFIIIVVAAAIVEVTPYNVITKSQTNQEVEPLCSG